MEYGIQMYSVRDMTKEDLAGALRAVAEIGYKFVEFAGFFGHSAEAVRAMLDENGLKVSGTHTGVSELTPEKIEETIAYHKIIGNKNIIIPGADMSTREKLDGVLEIIRFAKPVLAANGIKLGYHNHAGEFKETSYGAFIHKELEETTDVAFEIDTYWAYVAGEDPVATLERLKDRVDVIHIKDGSADGHGQPLGRGTAPVAAVYAKARELGMRMVVESETLTPDGITEARICYEYLKSIEG